MHLPRRLLVLLSCLALPLAACGDDQGSSSGGGGRVVVTTNLLADVVSELLGDVAEVTTVVPVGANPHDFQASAQQAAAMREADILITNGAGFEESLLEVIEGAEADGVPVYEAMEAVEVLELGAEVHGTAAEHDEEDEPAQDGDHADEGEDAGHGEEGHSHEGEDPHFFTDPARMAVAAQGILDAVLEELPELDTEAVRDRAASYIGELEALDAEVARILDVVPVDRRVLVTNHEVFGYFADRYGFEVVGTVIPGGGTGESVSAGALSTLIELIEHEGVPAIFADTSSPADLAETLAKDVGDVEVVELFSESLGEPGSGGETYLEMVRTNAERIADALS